MPLGEDCPCEVKDGDGVTVVRFTAARLALNEDNAPAEAKPGKPGKSGVNGCPAEPFPSGG